MFFLFQVMMKHFYSISLLQHDRPVNHQSIRFGDFSDSSVLFWTVEVEKPMETPVHEKTWPLKGV